MFSPSPTHILSSVCPIPLSTLALAGLAAIGEALDATVIAKTASLTF